MATEPSSSTRRPPPNCNRATASPPVQRSRSSVRPATRRPTQPVPLWWSSRGGADDPRTVLPAAMTQPAEHALFDRWTGRHASTLQAALRMSQDEMAAKLGVSKRTVASWHANPDVTIRPELQRALDTVYEGAPEPVKLRFARQLSTDAAADAEAASQGVALAVAIAVVVNDDKVLIVCRRDPEPSGLTWQFPAGIVKPGA